jgi:hypothetical protein
MAVPGLDPGIVPAIHAPSLPSPACGEGREGQDVDARHKAGHDESASSLRHLAAHSAGFAAAVALAFALRSTQRTDNTEAS